MILYSQDEIRSIKRSNQVVAKILNELKKMIKPGVQTKELDEYAEMRTAEMGARPAFKGYRGYPSSLCVSINEEIVHGIPSSRYLQEGDIVSLDFGVLFEGYYGDAAKTYGVGEISQRAARLVETAEQAFYKAMEVMKPQNRISDVSFAIQTYVESQGFSVIRAFVGHGIGLSLHEEPQIPNFGSPGLGPKIKPGMVLAIEPMIAMGDWNVEILDDNWTAVTKDRSLASHFEHTVAINSNGTVILSLLEEEEKSAFCLKDNQHA